MLKFREFISEGKAMDDAFKAIDNAFTPEKVKAMFAKVDKNRENDPGFQKWKKTHRGDALKGKLNKALDRASHERKHEND
jgi:hypothetical protein